MSLQGPNACGGCRCRGPSCVNGPRVGPRRAHARHEAHALELVCLRAIYWAAHQLSIRILGRRAAPFPAFLISNRDPAWSYPKILVLTISTKPPRSGGAQPCACHHIHIPIPGQA